MAKGKKLDPPFEDTVFPIFEQPEPEPVRVKSRKEQDDAANKIVYRRYRPTRRVQCDPCVSAVVIKEQTGINDASYVRTQGSSEQYLCFLHTQEAKHRDQLNPYGQR